MTIALDAAPAAPYPIRLWMEYPRKLGRLSTAFRLVLVIPVLFFLYLLQANVVAAMWATILVRGRIPHWLFDFEVGLNRFSFRAWSYFALLTDKYPAFEGSWPLEYEADYPERLSRWRVFFWKMLASIPHFIVLVFLGFAVAICIVIAWFAILFTGAFPRGLHNFVVGFTRWTARVGAYVTSLTDAYPPFSFEENAGPGTNEVLAGIIGGVIALVAAGAGAGIGAAVYRIYNDSDTVHVAYADALSGTLDPDDALVEKDRVEFVLVRAEDPAAYDILTARHGYRLVSFTVTYTNRKWVNGKGPDVKTDTIRLRATDGVHDPVLLTIDGSAAPSDVQHGVGPHVLIAIFEIAEDAGIKDLRAYPDDNTNRRVVWEFE